ncbi:Wzz/FepE/Etk N-terminal domain-containing protein [Herbaspirillum sp. NPDC101396]|uniref:Wzz/FepE/Etk N-terminal domain-containing protein n=1 Tax=Herbaspirillum sp. NPDC101396 TaxID=3364005 RepID=UPI00383BEE05
MNLQAPETGLSSKQLASMISARRGTIFKTLMATMAVTIVVTLLLPKTYTASSDVFLDYKGNDPINGRLFSPMMDESYMQTQLDMIKSQAVAEKVIDALDLERTAAYRESVERQGEARAHSQLVKRINDQTLVVTRRSSRVIEVEYAAGAPEQARDLANAVVRAYIDLNQQISSASARARREQYNAQLEHLRKEADSIQEKLTKYQQDVGILDPNERNDLQSRQLGDLMTSLIAVQNQQQEAQARKNATDSLVRGGLRIDELPEVAQRPNINDLKSKLSDVNKRLSDIQDVLGPRHPKTLALISERDDIATRITREARSSLDAQQIDARRLAMQEEALRKEVDSQRDKLLEQKKHRDIITSYQRQLDSVERVYNTALAKYDEILMASNINTFDLTVLRVAEVPSSHSKPLLLQNIAASILVGLALGFCLALLYELGQRRVRCEDDLVRGIHLPLIGHIGIR